MAELDFRTGELALIQSSHDAFLLTLGPDYTTTIDSENNIVLLYLGSPVSTSDIEYLSLISFLENGNTYEPGLGFLGDTIVNINGVPTIIDVIEETP